MHLFRILTPATYWVLIVLWLFILFFYIHRLRSKKFLNRLTRILLIILAIDAFRTLFESLYFGAWYTSLAGFLPKKIYTVLEQPGLVFVPKLTNVLTGILIIVILLHRWLPLEEQEKKEMKAMILEHTSELTEINEKLRTEIAERAVVEGSLRESEERYASLFQNNHSIMLLLDPETGGIVDANPAACAFYGFSKQAITNLKISDIALLTNEQMFHEMKHAGPENSRHFYFRHRLANGDTKNVEVYGGPLRVHGKELLHLIIHDISEQEEAAEEKASLQAQLRQAQKIEAIGTLAGGIAHDFNNILAAILGYADMVQETLPKGSQAWANQQQVLKAGERAKELVRQILAFSRQAEQEQKPLQMHLIVKEVLKLLRASLPTTIEIRSDIQSRGAILADPTQIHQVLMNLCTNAYHAMRETGGTLSVSLAETEIGPDDFIANLTLQPGKYLRLEVSDTGRGMDKALMERIFEPYFTTKAKGEGSGLGLSVVHGIVKSHNGYITVYSEPGKGTVFHVYLPLIEAVADTPKTETEQTMPRGTERILAVDDEMTIVQIEQRALEGLGYQVTAFTNSEEALQAFQAQPGGFDLVLTDMTMPHMTGAELTRKLIAIRADIPIILCTGFSETINEQKAKALGIREYVMKPMIIKEMARIIRKVLDEK